MGQRLNIEIRKDGKTLANSYYHWSGYTYPALFLTSIILDVASKIKEEEFPTDKRYAAELLLATGAKLSTEDANYAKKNGFSSLEVMEMTKNLNRNEGIIAIRPITKKNTRRYEEARVMIDVGRKIVNFNVFFWDSYVNEVDIKTRKKMTKLPVPASRVPFDCFIKFVKALQDDKRTQCFISGKNVYSVIE